ncbi:hypothetical protein F4805DRAFT_138367 [Annulohypoxylon moriforme]|nr:hypothetical protein F4805DRAFT_138367 [Annulohypoxylon moriforme]
MQRLIFLLSGVSNLPGFQYVLFFGVRAYTRNFVWVAPNSSTHMRAAYSHHVLTSFLPKSVYIHTYIGHRSFSPFPPPSSNRIGSRLRTTWNPKQVLRHEPRNLLFRLRPSRTRGELKRTS